MENSSCEFAPISTSGGMRQDGEAVSQSSNSRLDLQAVAELKFLDVAEGERATSRDAVLEAEKVHNHQPGIDYDAGEPDAQHVYEYLPPPPDAHASAAFHGPGGHLPAKEAYSVAPTHSPEEETTPTAKPNTYFDRELAELNELEAGGGSMQHGVEFTFRTGAVYTGGWQGNQRHGQGAQAWPDGAVYEGQWSLNRADGFGRFSHRDGDIYTGSWKANVAHGQGVYYHQDLTVYAGNWVDDLQDGCGVESWNEGARYEGQFSKGQKGGHGTYYWPDGSVYHGRWTGNSINGEGAYLGCDGRSYKGEWEESVIHGVGKYVWQDGRLYSGQYAADRKEGFGIFSWPDGKQFTGYWSDGLQHGDGEYTLENGSIKHVSFFEGARTVGDDTISERSVPEEE